MIGSWKGDRQLVGKLVGKLVDGYTEATLFDLKMATDILDFVIFFKKSMIKKRKKKEIRTKN